MLETDCLSMALSFDSTSIVCDREKAEQTIWNRLQELTAMKNKRLRSPTPMKIGILGIVFSPPPYSSIIFS